MTADEIRGKYTPFFEDILRQTESKVLSSDTIALFATGILTEIAAQLAEANALAKLRLQGKYELMPQEVRDALEKL